jgi:site-specific DNA recombinase
MISDLKTGRIKGLIFTKLARLARNLKELIEFSDLFQKYHADMISLEEGFDTSTPAGKLLYHVIGALAQWEREEISARVAASIPIRAELGKPLGGEATFGYQWKGKKLVPHPKEAPLRRLEYELFIQHRNAERAAKAFNEAGYRLRPTKQYPDGSPLTDTTLRRHIEDPTPAGIHILNYTKSRGKGRGWDEKPEKVWVKIKVPAIIDKKTWEEANKVLKQIALGKRTKPPKQHLLGGYIYCGICKNEKKMYGHAAERETPKYVCQNHCGNRIPIEDLDNLFISGLKNLVIKPEQLKGERPEQADVKQVESRAKTLKKELLGIRKKIDVLIELFENKSLNHASFKERIHPLETRREQINKELARLDGEIAYHRIEQVNKDHVIERSRTFAEMFPQLDMQQMKAFVESILDKVIVGKNNIQFILYSLPEFVSSNSPDPDDPDNTPKSNLGSPENSPHNDRDSLPRLT